MAQRVKHIPEAEVTSRRKQLLRKEVIIMSLEIHTSLQIEYQETEVSKTVP